MESIKLSTSSRNSELIFNNISFLLKNPGINMLGPSTFYKSAKKFMYLNYNSVNRFLNYLNKDDLDLVSDLGFFCWYNVFGIRNF